MMCEKEILILNHYRQIIENYDFDEYDLIGFLIFIRQEVKNNNFNGILEFCDLIAHRIRDRGRAMKSMRNAIENDYTTNYNTKSIRGYNGIAYNDWEKEWKKLFSLLNIKFTDRTILEISLCIISLAQNVQFKETGYFRIFQNNKNEISLCTTEGKDDSLFVVFFNAGPFAFEKNYREGIILEAVETVRVDGILKLKCNEEYILSSIK